jgi:hypothetical protein
MTYKFVLDERQLVRRAAFFEHIGATPVVSDAEKILSGGGNEDEIISRQRSPERGCWSGVGGHQCRGGDCANAEHAVAGTCVDR